jgi:hypothetical protein
MIIRWPLIDNHETAIDNLLLAYWGGAQNKGGHTESFVVHHSDYQIVINYHTREHRNEFSNRDA